MSPLPRGGVRGGVRDPFLPGRRTLRCLMQRNERQREEQLLFSQVSHADPMIRRENGLESLGRAIRFPGIGDQSHSTAAFHRAYERRKAALASELGSCRDLNVRNGHSALPAEAHATRHATLGAR